MIDWSDPITARWRRELFEHVRSKLEVPSSSMWNLIALINRIHPEWQDDTILVHIAGFFAAQIPERIWTFWHEVENHAEKLEIIHPAASDRRRRRKVACPRRSEFSLGKRGGIHR